MASQLAVFRQGHRPQPDSLRYALERLVWVFDDRYEIPRQRPANLRGPNSLSA